jgi:hypothetical protein
LRKARKGRINPVGPGNCRVGTRLSMVNKR